MRENASPDKKKPSEAGELMYVRCARCGQWLDVKPGRINAVSHGLCPECFALEMGRLDQEDDRRRKNSNRRAP